MAETTVRLGLIGAGRWGRAYIRTIAEMADVTLARLASRNPESAALVGPGCAISEDWQEVAGAPDLDGVIIATPHALHGEMTRAAIAAGRPALVEKPLTMDTAEARGVLDLAARRSASVVVDHVHLFHPAYRALKARVAELGPVRTIRSAGGDWRPDDGRGSVLWDWGPHDVAMCLDLLGRSPDSVTATRKERRHTPEGVGETLALHLEFPGGAVADIEIGTLMLHKTRYFAANCDRYQLVYDDQRAAPLVVQPRLEDACVAMQLKEKVAVAPDRPLTCAVADFAAAIRAGSRDLASLRLGVDVVAVLEECQRLLGRDPRSAGAD